MPNNRRLASSVFCINFQPELHGLTNVGNSFCAVAALRHTARQGRTFGDEPAVFCFGKNHLVLHSEIVPWNVGPSNYVSAKACNLLANTGFDSPGYCLMFCVLQKLFQLYPIACQRFKVRSFNPAFSQKASKSSKRDWVFIRGDGYAIAYAGDGNYVVAAASAGFANPLAKIGVEKVKEFAGAKTVHALKGAPLVAL